MSRGGYVLKREEDSGVDLHRHEGEKCECVTDTSRTRSL